MARDIAFPKAINAEVNRIIDDAKNRGIIRTIGVLAQYLQMTKDEVYCRTRERPITGWTLGQLTQLMELFEGEGEYGLAGRVLRIILPDFDVCFRQEIVGTGDPSGDILDDEAVLIQSIGGLAGEVHEAVKDGKITLAERTRIVEGINIIQRALNAVAEDVDREAERSDG